MKGILAAGLAAVALAAGAETKVGIIGLDTSHALAFTKIMNVTKAEFCRDFRVTAAYQWGSRDIVSSTNRYPKYIAQMKEMGVEIVPSIADLLAKVDCVCLETNDGREHLAQALEVFRSGKRVFIDKPIAHNYEDAWRIYEAGLKTNAKYFSSSALRYSKVTQELRAGKHGAVQGGDFFSPSPVEEQGTHSRYTWYGIHGFEPMVTVMGTGAESVRTVSGGPVDLVVVKWKDGRIATLRANQKAWNYGGTAFLVDGKKKPVALGGYEGYEPLLERIVEFFRTGVVPVPNDETLEIFAIMEAAAMSQAAGGEEVTLDKVRASVRR